MSIPEVNGKAILLYQASEEPSIEKSMQSLLDCGVIPIACENPNNFRFVVPEVVTAAQVDLIGRAALQALGKDNPMTTFVNVIRQALAPSDKADATK